ncbi:MAG: GNVR domain-containing protein [Ignavibacteria bacterium]
MEETIESKNNNKNEKIYKEDDSSLSILDLIYVFIKYKTKIIIFTLIFMIISIILYFFVFDLIYYSTASVKSTGKSSSLLSSIADFGDLQDLDPFSVGGKSAKELAVYEDILKSRRCIEPLIDKFDLMKDGDYRFKEDAIKDFTDNKLVTEKAKLSGIMELGVYYKDPVIAKEMVEFLLSQLDRINIEMNVQSAKNNRIFIENRYNQSRLDLTHAEDSLKDFQMIYGVAPDLQIKASAQSVFTLEAELKAEEVKLDVIRKILSADQPEVKLQEAKVSSLRDKITSINTSTDLNDFLRLGNSPQIAISFLRLQRELEIQQKILTFLLPLYEQAKIEEKRETPTIIVLDQPYIAERKSKPKRLTMVVFFTVFGFVASFVLSGIHYRYRIFKQSDMYKKIINK